MQCLQRIDTGYSHFLSWDTVSIFPSHSRSLETLTTIEEKLVILQGGHLPHLFDKRVIQQLSCCWSLCTKSHASNYCPKVMQLTFLLV